MNTIFNYIMQYFGKLGKVKIFLFAFIQILLFGMIDYLTGSELTLCIFYLFPIMLVAWFVNRRTGVYFAFMGAVLWLIADASARKWNLYSIGFFFNHHLYSLSPETILG